MRQSAAASDVEDRVVAEFALREVIDCVVDDVISAEGSNQIDFRSAGHAGDLSAERLGVDCVR